MEAWLFGGGNIFKWDRAKRTGFPCARGRKLGPFKLRRGNCENWPKKSEIGAEKTSSGQPGQKGLSCKKGHDREGPTFGHKKLEKVTFTGDNL